MEKFLLKLYGSMNKRKDTEGNISPLVLIKVTFIATFLAGLFLLPLQYSLEKNSDIELEYSYSLEYPKMLLDKLTIGNANVEINDVNTSSLYRQSIKIWNSGEIPIKDLPILYVFETQSPTFQILAVTHNTKPKYEFGKISLIKEDQYSKKYVYDLLNTNDEFTITILTNEEVPPSVHSKIEGLSTIPVIPPEEDRLLLEILTNIIASFITVILLIVELKLMPYSHRQTILNYLNSINKK